MPRKSEIQAEEAVTSSPLRRSSRINVAANGAPATLSTRRNSSSLAEAPEAKAPKSRRASLSQENADKDDKKENKPAPRGRRGSTTKEETEPKPEPAKTRSRRSSANTEPPAKVEESKPITRRRRSSAAEDPPEPETVRPVRGRRSSVTDKPEEEDAEKKNIRGKRTVKEETVKEEPVRKSVRGRRGSTTDISEENVDIETEKEKKKPTRGRRSSTDKLEDEPEVKIARLTPSKSRRRLSVTENLISLEPIEEQDSETKGRKSNSPMKTELKVVVESSPPKNKASEERQSTSLSKASKSTPVKSRRRLSIAESAASLEPIEEQESERRARKSISPEKAELRVVLVPSPAISETSEENQPKSNKSTPVKSKKSATEMEPIEEQESNMKRRKSMSPELKVVLSPSVKNETSEENKTHSSKSRRLPFADDSEATATGSLTPVRKITPDRLHREKTNLELSVIQETSFMEEDPEEDRPEEKGALRKSPRLQNRNANTPPPPRRSPRLNENTIKEDESLLDEELEDKDENHQASRNKGGEDSSNAKEKSEDAEARKELVVQKAPLDQEPEDVDDDFEEVSSKSVNREESSNKKVESEDADAEEGVGETETVPLDQETEDRDENRKETSRDNEDREESSNKEVKSEDAEALEEVEGGGKAPVAEEPEDLDDEFEETSSKSENREKFSNEKVKSEDTEALDEIEDTNKTLLDQEPEVIDEKCKEASNKNEDREESSNKEVKSEDLEAQEDVDVDSSAGRAESHLEGDENNEDTNENREAVGEDQVFKEECADVKRPEVEEATSSGGKIEEITTQDTKEEISKSESEYPDISMGSDGSFRFQLNVSLPNTNSQNLSQKDIEEPDDLNTSKTSNGSDKENLDVNMAEEESKMIKEKLEDKNEEIGIKAQSIVVARVSNVFRPKMKENSFMEPMDVDESILSTSHNKMPLDLDESNVDDAPPAKSTPVAARSIKKTEKQENNVVIISKNESRCKESTEIEECDSVDDSFKLSLSVSRISQHDVSSAKHGTVADSECLKDSENKETNPNLKESMVEESKADISEVIPVATVIEVKKTECDALKMEDQKGNKAQIDTSSHSIKTGEETDDAEEHEQKDKRLLSNKSEKPNDEVKLEEKGAQSSETKSSPNLELNNSSKETLQEDKKSISSNCNKEKDQSNDSKSTEQDSQKPSSSASFNKVEDIEEPINEDTKLSHIDQSSDHKQKQEISSKSTESLIEDTKQRKPKSQFDLPGEVKEKDDSGKISENLDVAKQEKSDSTISSTKTNLLNETEDMTDDNSALAKSEAPKMMREGKIEETSSSTQTKNISEEAKKPVSSKATKIKETSDASDTEAVQSPEIRKMDMSDEYEFDVPSDEEEIEKEKPQEIPVERQDKESKRMISSEDRGAEETDKLSKEPDLQQPKSKKACTNEEVESREILKEVGINEKQGIEMMSDKEVLSSKDNNERNMDIPEESTDELKTEEVTMTKKIGATPDNVTEDLNEELSSQGVQEEEENDHNELEIESISTGQEKKMQSEEGTSDSTEDQSNASAVKNTETEYEEMEKDFKDIVKDQGEQKTEEKDNGDGQMANDVNISPDLATQGMEGSENITESTDRAEVVNPDDKKAVNFETKSGRKKWSKSKATVNEESEENILEVGRLKKDSEGKNRSEDNIKEDKVTLKAVTIFSKADSYEEKEFSKTEYKNKYEETKTDYFVADSTDDIEENTRSDELQVKPSEINTENEGHLKEDEVKQNANDSVEGASENTEGDKEETGDDGNSDRIVKTPKKKSKKSKKSKRNVENKGDELESENIEESPLTEEDMEDKEAVEDISASQAEKTEKRKKKRKRKLEHQTTDSGDDVSPKKRLVSLSSLEQSANPKLDAYLAKAISEMESDNESYEEASEELEEESEKEENEYICTMAEEGEEDTPSEGSNDIIDEGESLHSTDTEIDPESEYDEEDSFICDDEEQELLSGEEFDLDDEKKEKGEKKSRIIQLDSYGDDDEVIKIERKEKPVKKKKKSRIITITDSSESENEHPQEEDKECVEAEEKTETASEPPEPTESNEGDSDGEKAVDDDVIILEEKSTSFIKPVSVEMFSSVSENDEDQARKSKRKSSITIHENISVSEIKDAALSERISNLVDTFCTSIRKGEISMNLSLEYAGKDDTAQSKEESQSDQKSSSLSDDIFLPPEEGVQLAKKSKRRRKKKKANKSPELVSISSGEGTSGTSTKRADRLSVTLDNIEDSDESIKRAARKRRLSKSLENLNEIPAKKKKKKANKAWQSKAKQELVETSPKRTKKQKKHHSSEDDLRTQTLSIMNQLITDVKKRPVRRINPSRDTPDIDDSWITEVADVRPSTTIITRRERTEYKSGKVHPKDFRSQMLNDPSRIRRVDTKKLLKKRGAYF